MARRDVGMMRRQNPARRIARQMQRRRGWIALI